MEMDDNNDQPAPLSQSSGQNGTHVGEGRHEPSCVDIGGTRRISGSTERSMSERCGGPNLISESEVKEPGSLHSSRCSSVSEESGAGHRSPPGSEPRPAAARSVSEVRDGIENRVELGLGQPLEKQPPPRNLADENLVTWDVDDPDNPKTWSMGKKWAAVAIVSLFTLISPVSSTMTAPALDSIGAELNMTSEFEKELSLSIFVLGEAP